ncbi:MAG: DnaJ domain-containing protein [Hyphomicrobiales bacterium]|nr:DnaJ domain-containing protein [Hyphomicrobiales bacterium]MDE2016366.1 DnaJ domain-containing protein [Hyphomicrobiales bacterium]
MARDPYLVLGLSKGASEAEIKKAFRRLAKKFHPDQSKEPRAKDQFAEVNQAYEILGDAKKRAAFDRGEIDAEGKQRFQGFEGFQQGARAGAGGGRRFEYEFGDAARGGQAGFDPSDILSELFGGARGGRRSRGPHRGEDVVAVATIPLKEAVLGGSVRVSMPNGKTLDVTIPAGSDDGRQIRLRGQGQASPDGGEAGDAIVSLKIAPHPHFRVEGRDLRLDLPVTLYEAALGAKVRAPTLSGEVELGIPPGSNSGRVLRLRGKGLPAGAGGPAGDLLVTLRAMLPEAADPALETLLKKMRADAPYDPRGKAFNE